MAKQARPLQGYEIARLTEGAAPRDAALVWCCLGAGLRAAEAAALLCGDVGQDGAVTVRHGKGDKARIVYLTGQAMEVVSQHRATLEHQGTADPLFPSRKRRGGRPASMLATSAVNLFKALLEARGISNASSHSLRRTHAQGLEAQGASVRVIQVQLGHESVATTERYLAQCPPRHREQVRALNFSVGGA
jgi:integrase/recombinase XerD